MTPNLLGLLSLAWPDRYFFFLCGDTKVVLSHLEVLTLYNLFFGHKRYFIGNKAPAICFI